MRLSRHPLTFVAGILCGAFASYWLRPAQNIVAPARPSTGGHIASPPENPLLSPTTASKRIQPGSAAVPTLGGLSDATLRRLNISCLGPDGTLDPMLKELAGLSDAEFSQLETIIAATLDAHTAKEANRFVSLTTSEVPTVIIPPDPLASAGIEQDYLKSVSNLAGSERASVVTRALARGMEEATGNFGRQVRSISFTASKPDRPDVPVVYLVRVGAYEGDVRGEVERQDWNAFADRMPANMSSFSCVQLPERFRVFAEQAASKK